MPADRQQAINRVRRGNFIGGSGGGFERAVVRKTWLNAMLEQRALVMVVASERRLPVPRVALGQSAQPVVPLPGRKMG